MKRIAVYPGSFDPLTKGHLDIIQRASRLFDQVIVAVLENSTKTATFTVQERVEMIQEVVRGIRGVQVDHFSGLLVDYLKKKNSRVLIRGLRAVSDMDYEFQIASFNRRLYRDVETIFLMPDEQYTYLASSMVKEVARLGAELHDFVPSAIAGRLRRKFSKRSK